MDSGAGFAAAEGRSAFLNLIKGHLPTEYKTFAGSHHYRLKIQPFKAGGYEVTCKTVQSVSLLPRKIESRMTDNELLNYYWSMSDRKYNAIQAAKYRRNASELPDDYEPQHRSIRRSKTNSRYKIKSMGADRLLTLTARELNPDTYMTNEQWKAAWADYCRLMRRAGYPVGDYLAVLERHKKGNYHLHVAIKGYVHLNTANRVWWSVMGGRGLGAVNVRYRPDLSPTKRLSGISKYLSKYLAKQFGYSEFNKKRYWSSKHSLPDAKKYAISPAIGTINDVLKEFAARWGLDYNELSKKSNCWMFEHGTGFWFNYTEDVLSPVPF